MTKDAHDDGEYQLRAEEKMGPRVKREDMPPGMYDALRYLTLTHSIRGRNTPMRVDHLRLVMRHMASTTMRDRTAEYLEGR